MLAYVRRLAPAGCEGVDILQEVGLRLLGQPEMAAPRLTAWCKAVAKHIVYHELRTARYERAMLAELGSGSQPDAGQSERQVILRSIIACELERLDRFSGELLIRRYLFEQTSSEIAREINMSAAAVRMRLMRLRGELGGSSPPDQDEDPPPNSQTRPKVERSDRPSAPSDRQDGDPEPSPSARGSRCRRSA